MLRSGSSDWYCGGSVSQCLTGWDRLVSGHRPHQLSSAGCVFISENKIPIQYKSVGRTRKAEDIIVFFKSALLRISFVTLPWRRWQKTHLYTLRGQVCVCGSAHVKSSSEVELASMLMTWDPLRRAFNFEGNFQLEYLLYKVILIVLKHF